MTGLLAKRYVQFLIALAIAFAGLFLLPPHVLGVYIPLGSLLFREEVWRGEPGRYFWSAIFIELAVYSGLLYGILRLALRLLRRNDSDDHVSLRDRRSSVE